MITAPGPLVAGVDFGSDAVRVSVVDIVSGDALMSVSRSYTRWAAGLYCDPNSNRFRQHPRDYIEALESCFSAVGDRFGDGAVTALAIDATGSTPAPVDRRGVPLAMLDDFADDPDAMFWLWKDRTSTAEAAIVNAALSSAQPDHTQFQGVYSSEWWWAKILRGVTLNERVREAAYSWVEHSDWLANALVGNDDVVTFGRNACAAGHKALYSERLGGQVPAEVLASIDPYLAAVSETFRTPPLSAGSLLGTVSEEWAARLRLSTDTVVGVGSLDAHAGGVGAGIDARSMVKVMGTSTVDMFLTDYDAIDGRNLRSLCGIAENSIVPGYLGGETSQAAFGDLFAWFSRVLAWSIDNVLLPRLRDVVGDHDRVAIRADALDSMLSTLEASVIARAPTDIVALDWINGRRYPDVDETASAALVGLRIGHDAVDIYRALVQAAVLGSKAIYDRLADADIRFERVILVGGIAKKSPFICQSMADALNTEVLVSDENEACAMGSAMYAATARGYFASVADAQHRLSHGFAASYRPDPEGVDRYRRSFAAYRAIGDILGEDTDVRVGESKVGR